MPPRHTKTPSVKLTIGGVDYTDVNGISTTVTRVENGFDTATIVIADPNNDFYPTVTYGSTVAVATKDYWETAYTTVFNGAARFPIIEDKKVTLKCDGAGYGLGENVCVNEYGTQSLNPALDTITEILTDATHGVIPLYANKFLGSATDTNFAYTTAGVDAINDVIPYTISAYKPVNKYLNDLCDIVTALKAGTAGPHWIVDTASDLHVKLVNGTQATWTKYYLDSQANSTFEPDDYIAPPQLEVMNPDANVIIYYGTWRRPSSGDAWTENNHAVWSEEGGGTLSDDNTNHIVNTYSLRCTVDVGGAPMLWAYPLAKDAAWDFNSFTDFNTPNLNFYMFTHSGGGAFGGITVNLHTDGANYVTKLLAETTDTWVHYALPIGPYYRNTVAGGTSWTVGGGAIDWSDIDYIQFIGLTPPAGSYMCVDGLHFGDAAVCRVATDSTMMAAGKVKTKVLTDSVGKDDSLLDTDDSGLMAKMAYAELLRQSKTAITGAFTVSLRKDLLPGQWVHLHARKKLDGTFGVNKDFRVTKLVHYFELPTPMTVVTVTDDVTNSTVRPAYESYNAQSALMRPEFQDKQASSIKLGELDIRITRLTKDYPT